MSNTQNQDELEVNKPPIPVDVDTQDVNNTQNQDELDDLIEWLAGSFKQFKNSDPMASTDAPCLIAAELAKHKIMSLIQANYKPIGEIEAAIGEDIPAAGASNEEWLNGWKGGYNAATAHIRKALNIGRKTNKRRMIL